ncbi:VWA domain-containing protein [Actinokineospora guangxiensis]|uniref:VWA domain-containing protein n=1 Tax=Actinokineospora guangxiensis TaxID=1490288 RepID=A0ABW0EFX8_9PSEU
MTSDLERWRLVLGVPASGVADLDADTAARDSALSWLYGRDPGLAQRGVRGAGGEGSQLTTVDWLDDVHRLFPRETVERLERDAVERYDIHEVVTDPDVLARVEPNPALLRAVLRTKHLMNPEVLSLARKLVAEVVRQLVEKMAVEVKRSMTGTRVRKPSQFKIARDFDFRGTVKANLKHYQPESRKVLIEHTRFQSRTRKHVEPWQLVLLVDQSGSMAGSVIHSAVTASCLWGVPGLRTHLIAFDTDIADLTSDVSDPVELLMKVQLGGGTDIARATRYGAGLVESPRRAIVAIVSDFYEGGDEHNLVRTVKGLVEQGTHVLCLAALDEDAVPTYDRQLAQRLADVGAHVGAMTPGQLAEFVAERIGR